MVRSIRKKIPYIIFAVILSVVAWRVISNIQTAKEKTKKETTYTVKRKHIKQTMTISGKIDAKEKATVKFQSSGMLAWVGVKEGEQVNRYQALASLDQKQLKKNLEKYLNTYMKYRWDFEQKKDTHFDTPYWGLDQEGRKEIDRTFEKAGFDLNNSVLDVELQDIVLKYATLTSPIDGIITKVGFPYPGINVVYTDTMFEILNPNSVYVSVLADQTEVTKVTAGMVAELVFDAFPDVKKEGVVEDIAFTPKAGETSTVWEVKVKLTPEDIQTTPYRIGMTVDATFLINEKQDVLVIPTQFLNSDGDKRYTYKQTEKKKEKIYVETGIESDTMIEITSGLADGDILYD